MSIIAKLAQIRSNTGTAYTAGLADEVIASFAENDENLNRAVNEAVQYHNMVKEEYPELLNKEELELCALFKRTSLISTVQTLLTPT